MVEQGSNATDRYLVTLRIIQPARQQDIIAAFGVIWDIKIDERLTNTIETIHEQMRTLGFLMPVRKGTYVLTQKGMEISAGLFKERNIDNARMFLMKRQRKTYSKIARRLG